MSDPRNRAGDALSLVTVVFEAEVPLLRLQAASLARFVAVADFAQIVVIDNTNRGLTARARRALLNEYGPWAPRVIFLRPDDISPVPVGTGGWVGQQILKLMVHPHVKTAFYLVLDAKNHWVRPTTVDEFIAPDGRARGASHSYREHALRPSLERVLAYLDIDAPAWIDLFPVTHTPVVLATDIVRELVEAVEERSGRPFHEEFRAAGLTEFFLYAGWLVSRYGGVDGHLDGTVIRSATVWPRDARTSGVTRVLDDLARLDPPFLSVHRTALARTDHSAAQALARFWTDRRLFPDRRSALAFLVAYKLRYLAAMSVRRVRAEVTKRRATN